VENNFLFGKVDSKLENHNKLKVEEKSNYLLVVGNFGTIISFAALGRCWC
jgi:hypothetical protein